MSGTGRKKSLTIHNTDRYVNIKLLEKYKIDQSTKVTSLNKKEIEKKLLKLKKKSRRLPLKDDENYILYDETYMDDGFAELIMQHSGGISYYTESTVPYYIIEHLASKSDSQAIYAIKKEYSNKEVDNIELASMATETVIDLPVVLPYTNPYDVMFSLHPLKVHVDKVHLSFPPLRESELMECSKDFYELKEDELYHADVASRFEFVRYIRESLSIWKMNIYLICEDKDSYLESHMILDDIMNKRNPNRKKKAGVENGK